MWDQVLLNAVCHNARDSFDHAIRKYNVCFLHAFDNVVICRNPVAAHEKARTEGFTLTILVVCNDYDDPWTGSVENLRRR